MANAVKEKVTISLDPALVALVDQEVRRHHADSRSAVVEDALRIWQMRERRRAIEHGVEEYYRSRSRREEKEDRIWSRLGSHAARQLWND